MSMNDLTYDMSQVPESFTERFLWNPRLTTTVTSSGNPQGTPIDPSEPIQPYQFSDQTLAEIQAVLSYKLWSSSQPTISTRPEAEPADIPIGFTLYCPLDGAHDVIDSLVRLVAAHEMADVLVLDALELAAGQFGALGKSGSILDDVYKAAFASKTSSSDESQNPNIDDQSIQRFFDLLVNIEARSIPGENGRSCDQNNSGPRRRIIYLRDFGSIARAAKPLMIFILQAIKNSSQGGNSRALVMGVTASKESSKVPAGERRRGLFSFLSDTPTPKPSPNLGESRQLLRNSIPSIKCKWPMLKKSVSSAPLNALGAALFLPLTTTPSELEHKKFNMDTARGRMVDCLASSELLFALPTNVGSQAFREVQQATTLARRKDINDMLLRIHLGVGGGSTCEGLSREILVKPNKKGEKEDFLSSILDWSTATAITTNAIGLACMESPGAPVPISVSASNVAKAYKLLVQNDRARAEWVDKEKATRSLGDKCEEADREIETTKESEKRNDSDRDNDADHPRDSEKEDLILKRVRESRDLSSAEQKYLQCVVKPQSLLTRFDDVCVDSTIIETIRTVISLPLLHPAYFKTGLLSKECLTGVLLYGPPGTGKTMLCRALASECEARMLFVKPSDILECYVGESEKNIAGLFSLAGRLAPCILFVDEVDALFSARDGSTKSWRRDMLTEFMQSMDGLLSAGENRNKGIIVVGATNRPFDLDEAILRRLPCRMLVDLPPEPERLKILKLYLKEENLHDDVDLHQIAQDTEDYSGSDLKSLCVAAAMTCVKNAIGEIDWKPGYRDTLSTSTPRNAERSTKTRSQAVIRRAHFDQALSTVFPSFSEKASAELYRWHGKSSLGTSSRQGVPPTKKLDGKAGSNVTSSHKNGRKDIEMERFMTSMFGKKD